MIRRLKEAESKIDDCTAPVENLSELTKKIQQSVFFLKKYDYYYKLNNLNFCLFKKILFLLTL